MKSIKIFFFLILFCTIFSQILEIENGQTIELFFGNETEKTIIYNFNVPESEIYEGAVIVYNAVSDDQMYIAVNEDGKESYSYSNSAFIHHVLSPIQNKTLIFTINKMRGTNLKFTLLDLTKEIPTT